MIKSDEEILSCSGTKLDEDAQQHKRIRCSCNFHDEIYCQCEMDKQKKLAREDVSVRCTACGKPWSALDLTCPDCLEKIKKLAREDEREKHHKWCICDSKNGHRLEEVIEQKEKEIQTLKDALKIRNDWIKETIRWIEGDKYDMTLTRSWKLHKEKLRAEGERTDKTKKALEVK